MPRYAHRLSDMRPELLGIKEQRQTVAAAKATSTVHSMPSFRPIILPSGTPAGPSVGAAQAPVAAPEDDLEEGELPQPSSDAGRPTSVAGAPEPRLPPSPAAELSPMPQSEVGSGEQNNNNDLSMDDVLHQVSTTRKRSRSPSVADRAEGVRPAQCPRSPS